MNKINLKKTLDTIRFFIKRIVSDEITIYSAQASYCLIISAIPFIMLILSLVSFIFPVSYESVSGWIDAIFPVAIRDFIYAITEEIFQKSIPILSFTALTALWSASRGIRAVEKGVMRVYHTKPNSNIFLNFFTSAIYTVCFIIILLITLILQVFGDIITDILSEHILFSTTELLLIRWVMFFALICLLFQVMYYFFDKRQTKFYKHLPGALFSSAGWLIFSNLFSLYMENFTNFSYIYGSLTAVVLLMLWLYFCMIILLLGAEINNIIYKIKNN